LGGHLECLQYAHEAGAPWDERTVFFAVQFERVAFVVYALERGCPSDALFADPWMSRLRGMDDLDAVWRARRRHHKARAIGRAWRAHAARRRRLEAATAALTARLPADVVREVLGRAWR